MHSTKVMLEEFISRDVTVRMTLSFQINCINYWLFSTANYYLIHLRQYSTSAEIAISIKNFLK